MHSQSPPIIHRDIKVENVLKGDNNDWKLCDFGSATSVSIQAGISLPVNLIRQLEDEIAECTTIHYRPPELCDLYSRNGINEKVDIWALGCLLYKLCYFVTPFENGGKLAILNAKYDLPASPPVSNEIKALIGTLLNVNPLARPTAVQALDMILSLKGNGTLVRLYSC